MPQPNGLIWRDFGDAPRLFLGSGKSDRPSQTLSQVALTVNHELNNAGAIIELQLNLLGRQTGKNPTLEGYLRQIRESLARMTRTVKALKRVRRIVLTDYVAGMKMLDLERSVEEDVTTETPATLHPPKGG